MIIDLRTFLCFAAVVSGTLWTRRRYIEDPRRSIAQNRLYGKKSYKRYLRLQEQRQQGTLKQKKRRLKQKWKNHLLAMPEEERNQYVENRKRTVEARKERTKEAFGKAIRVCVDLAYTDYTHERERLSLFRQLQRGWGANRKSETPVAIHLTSCTSNVFSLLEPFGVSGWEVATHEQSFDRAFDKSRIVYLTPDSSNVLHELDPQNVYVIGGLVDRPIRKNIALERARELGVNHGRLPLPEYTGIKGGSSVLNVNTIIELIAKWQGTSNWETAFESCIPRRYLKSKNTR